MADIEPKKEDLKLIEVIDTKGKGGILGGILGLARTVSAAEGFSIEVFRREKSGGRYIERHIGSILSKNAMVASEVKNSCDSMGVRNDDILLRVSLGGKLVTLKGTFTTTDQYNPGYQIVLELAVVNPKQIAIRERQQDDPVGLALAAIEGEFERYARLRSYDKLRTDDLEFRVKNILHAGSNKDIGLDVKGVHDVKILMDPYKQKELEAIREAGIDRTKVIESQKTDAIKSHFQRDERGKDRVVNAQDMDERRRQERLDAASRVLADVLATKMREMLDAGYSVQEILKEYPELRGLDAPLPLPAGPRGYTDTPDSSNLSSRTRQQGSESDSDEPIDGVAETDTSSPRGTSLQRLEGFFSYEIGVTFIPTRLTEAQRSIARRVGHTELEAFVVCAVDPNSPAATTSMMVGDVVVKVNEQIVSNVDMLAEALRLRDQAQQISLHVLRGEQEGMILYVNSVT